MPDIATAFLVICWTMAGAWLIIGELPSMAKHRIEQIFGVTNRWGKVLIGAMLLAFCSKQVYDWVNAYSFSLPLA